MTLKSFFSIFRSSRLVLFIMAVVCCYDPSDVFSAEVVDRIVAVVNDDLITLREFNKALEPFERQIRSRGYPAEHEQRLMYDVRQEMLDKMINDKLTEQEIKRVNITVSPVEIDQAVERLKRDRYYTDEQLRQVLAKDGMTIEDLRARVKDQILKRHLINQEIKSKIIITKEEIRRYYDSHPSEYGPANAYHLRNIVMIASGTSAFGKQLVLEKMENIHFLLQQGESFPALARQYSQSPLASEGGDLGFFKLNDLSSQIQQAITGKTAGEFTPVLDTEQGYQIFYIEAVAEQPGRSLDEVSVEISEKLYNEILDKKFEAWLIELKQHSHIKIIQ